MYKKSINLLRGIKMSDASWVDAIETQIYTLCHYIINENIDKCPFSKKEIKKKHF